jgi:hypothetical protein
MQQTMSGVVGNGLNTTIKYMRGAAGAGLGTTIKSPTLGNAPRSVCV